MQIVLTILIVAVGIFAAALWRLYCNRLYRKLVGEEIYKKRPLHEYQPGEISKAIDARCKTDKLFMYGFSILLAVVTIALCFVFLEING